ncbi:MAG: hypothetical protein ABEJ88_09110 [Halobacterium sp.]
MADLTDFQREGVEMIAADEMVPTALLRHHPEKGPVMLLQNGDADPKDPAPQLDLLAAYFAQLSDHLGMPVEDVHNAVDERLDEWDVEDRIEADQR